MVFVLQVPNTGLHPNFIVEYMIYCDMKLRPISPKTFIFAAQDIFPLTLRDISYSKCIILQSYTILIMCVAVTIFQ